MDRKGLFGEEKCKLNCTLQNSQVLFYCLLFLFNCERRAFEHFEGGESSASAQAKGGTLLNLSWDRRKVVRLGSGERWEQEVGRKLERKQWLDEIESYCRILF
jgi:hypothetical protein